MVRCILHLHLWILQSNRNWIIEKLRNHDHPEKVVIEFVETENYSDLDVVLDFAKQIHAVGSKIAIDDFGSGYSTFSTVIEIEPDFLKIDGSIVSKIANNHKSLIILDTVRYLADKMGTEAIAEFVETAEIQRILEEYQISYSQGYYFSKPAPFKELVTS